MRRHFRTRPPPVYRILLGYPSRAARTVAARLALIFLWHALWPLVIHALPLNWLYGLAWEMWGRVGPPDDFFRRGVAALEVQSLVRTMALSAASAAMHMLIGGVVALLLFRLSRRPQPRFYRFVRYWWLAWLYGTILIPSILLLMTVFLIPELAPHLLLLYALCAPALLARIEWYRRLRPIIPTCSRCGYNLTGLPEPRCPECGQPFEPRGDAP